MASTESHSLSRAVGFAPWLASPLLSGNVSKPALLAEAMAKVPLVLVENDKVRENISFEALSKYSEFWTVESPLYRSVEYFVKEAPADVTANKILSTLGNQVGISSKNIVLCNLTSSFVDQRVKEAFEISEVVASQERRQIELRWKKQQSSPNWLSSRKLYELLLQRDQKFFGYVHEARERLRSMRNNTHFFGAGEPLHVPQNDFANSGLEDSNSFIVNRERYLKWDTPLTTHFLKLNDQPDSDRSRVLASHFVICEALRNWGMVSTETIRRTISNFDLQLIEPYLGDLEVFADALTRTGSETFDPFAWDRREAQETFGWAG